MRELLRARFDRSTVTVTAALARAAALASALAMALALTSAVAAPAAAQTPAPADVADYLGTWSLAATIQGSPVELRLEIADRQGTVQAALVSAMRPEPVLIDQIEKTDAGLDLAYNASLDGTTIRIHLIATLADGKLSGTLGEESGAFSTPFTGTREAEPAGIVEAALQSGGDSAAPASPAATAAPTAPGAAAASRPTRRRFGSSQTQLAFGDKNVKILFGELKLGTPDRESFEQTAVGEVFEYTGSRCLKLFTDVDLRFGDTTVKTENLAPGYPGVYGLWLEKTADGWRLVFNQEGDVWGTMHDPAKDVVEIPLEQAALDAPQQDLTVALTKEGEQGGVLRIAWGDTAWSAKFTTP